MHKPTIGIIGAGKVGQTLARLWNEAGYAISGVYSRDSVHAELLAWQVGAEVMRTPVEVIQRSELTLLTVPDDVITPLAENIALQIGTEKLTGKAVIHTSGSRDKQALVALETIDMLTGSLHPAFPFADVDSAIAGLSGAAFAVEVSDPTLRDWLYGLVGALDGKVIDIPAGGKAQYHAALVIASNYTVTLYAVAQSLLMGVGASEQIAGVALNPLMQATLDNLRQTGIPVALTGPLVRADISTLETHMNALAHLDSHLLDVYIQLARLSYPMLEARGVDTQIIDSFLKTKD